MALIKCPECGKEISDKSSACIHCGAPLEDMNGTQVIIRANEHPNAWSWGASMVEIGIYNELGEELASLRSGASTSFFINKPIRICAKFKKNYWSQNKSFNYTEKAREKTASNFITLFSGKTTHLEISYIGGIWSIKLHISEIGMVTSN